jgi:hypothetical protein
VPGDSSPRSPSCSPPVSLARPFKDASRRRSRAVVGGGFYIANIAQAYWPHLIGSEPIDVLRSLAEEEQFYADPAARLRRAPSRRDDRPRRCDPRDHRRRAWLLAAHANNTRIYTSRESAADGLLTGVLVAFILRGPSWTSRALCSSSWRSSPGHGFRSALVAAARQPWADLVQGCTSGAWSFSRGAATATAA